MRRTVEILKESRSVQRVSSAGEKIAFIIFERFGFSAVRKWFSRRKLEKGRLRWFCYQVSIKK
jgi:hypothetical protein